MSKIYLILSLSVILSFSNCKSLQYYDNHPIGSINHKIPPLETRIDTISFVKSMKFENQLSFLPSDGILLSDLSGIFKDDIQSNICDNLNYNTGVAECKFISANIINSGLGNKFIDSSFIKISSLLNFPILGRKSTLEIEVSIKDKKQKILKKYNVTGISTIKGSFASGYSSKNIDRVVVNKAFMNALNNLKIDIDKDYSILDRSLTGSLSKTQLTQYKTIKKNTEFTRDSLKRQEFIKDSIRIQDAFSLYNEGNIKLNSNNFVGAIESYTKSIQLNSVYTNSFNNRGIAYLNLGKYKKAIKDFKMCLRIDPTSELAKNNKQIALKLQTEKTIAIVGAVSLALVGVASTINAVNNTPSNTTAYSGSQNITTSNNLNTTKQPTTCSYCNGTGRISDNSAPGFGSTETKWCNFCKKDVSYTHCCQCKICPSCGGKKVK